jgi:hypothetical protein
MFARTAPTTGPLAFIEDKLPFNPFAGADPQPPVLQEVVGKRAAFPLRIAHATDYIRPRVALIGYALPSGSSHSLELRLTFNTHTHHRTRHFQ